MNGAWRSLTGIGFILLVIAWGVEAGWAQQKPAGTTPLMLCATAEQINLCFSMEPGPPRAGESLMRVSLADRDGRPITDAKVTFICSMPKMSGMGDIKVPAALAKENQYEAKVNLGMGGAWTVAVRIARPQGKAVTATIPVEVKDE